MTDRPRRPLDADEQALASDLPRLHGRDQPGPALDARILAAARSAVAIHPAPVSARPSLRQRHWVLPVSAAATVAIAAGLAWQLRLPAIDSARMPAAATAPAASAENMMRVRMIERPVVTPPPPPPPQIDATPARRSMPSLPVAPAPSAEPARESLEHFHDEATGVFAAEPASAPPAAAPPAVTLSASPPAAAPAIQPKAAMRESAYAPRNETERAADSSADSSARNAMAADASGETQIDDIPADDVPPATMASPQARDAWLTRIRELLRTGEIDAAKASLAEFRHRHPDAPLPPELQQLDP